MADKKKLRKIYADNSTPTELFLDTMERIDEVNEKIEEIKLAPEPNYIDIIKPLIPSTKNGKDGHTPTDEEIISFIKPLIPASIPGKDGSIITPEEVRDKLKELKGGDKLSVLDLKDLEWLRTKEGMQWSSAGFKVYTDSTLTGDGSNGNPLSVVAKSSSSGFTNPMTTLGDMIYENGGTVLFSSFTNAGGVFSIAGTYTSVMLPVIDKPYIVNYGTAGGYQTSVTSATMYIYNYNPSTGLPIGSALASSNTVSSFPPWTTKTFTFSGANRITLNTGGHYCIVMHSASLSMLGGTGASTGGAKSSDGVNWTTTPYVFNYSIYLDLTPFPDRIPGNTTTSQLFLSSQGDGTNATAPQWATITLVTPGGPSNAIQFVDPVTGGFAGTGSATLDYSGNITNTGFLYTENGISNAMGDNSFVIQDSSLGSSFINSFGGTMGIGMGFISTPVFNLDLYDVSESGFDIGNSTTALWNVANTGIGTFAQVNASAPSNPSNSLNAVTVYDPATLYSDISVGVINSDESRRIPIISFYSHDTEDYFIGIFQFVDTNGNTQFQFFSLYNVGTSTGGMYFTATGPNYGLQILQSGEIISQSSGTPVNVFDDTAGNMVIHGSVTGASIKKSSGTVNQLLIADGSINPFYKGTTTLALGVKAITISGVTSSNIGMVSVLTPMTTSTLGNEYKVVCTTNTVTITAISSLGGTVTSDNSVLSYVIF